MNTTPYVSFVTWGRNDGYTPDYVRRVNRATSCLAGQLERAGVDAEIIVTEWNPAPGRPLLLDLLDLPKSLAHVAIRGITVPSKYHLHFTGAQERGIHIGEAANVGIRHARGRFIAPKASDTFFSPETIAMIARRDLDPETVYRIDRHDIEIDDPAVWDLGDEELLSRLATMPSARQAYIPQMDYWRLRDLHTNACGDFMLLAADYWRLLRGHPVDPTVLAFDLDSLVLHAAVAHGARECRWPDACRVYKPIHGHLSNSRLVYVFSLRQRILEALLARLVNWKAVHWARTRYDYPRRKISGVESVVGPSIERNFVQPASRWAAGEVPVPTQPEDWGLVREPLEQRVLCRADWLQEEIAVGS